MIDRGHKDADDALKDAEKRIRKAYNDAASDMEKKLRKRLEKFYERDAEQRAKLESGELDYIHYIQWREQYMLRTDQMKGIVADLAKEMNGMNNMASGIINDQMLDAFVLNFNYGAYEVCKAADLNMSFDLVDRRTVERLLQDNPKLMPKYKPKNKKDIEWNERKIADTLSHGIMTGKSIPNITKDIRQVTKMNREQAVRAARTMTTAAESAGRMQVYEEAKDMGIKMQKTWVATLDDRTRDAHIELDGVSVDIDDYFENSVGKIMFPGDPDCKNVENVYNCRCTIIASIKGYTKDFSRRQMDKSLGGMTYDEWKKQAEKKGKK